MILTVEVSGYWKFPEILLIFMNELGSKEIIGVNYVGILIGNSLIQLVISDFAQDPLSNKNAMLLGIFERKSRLLSCKF
jgi:hypothetical protein